MRLVHDSSRLSSVSIGDDFDYSGIEKVLVENRQNAEAYFDSCIRMALS